ncbi:MAG TPA: choice-of-anchor D domain-containing protein, partial [Anaeromyxobacter sp.]|nr:choice-of-anchor D domain-containing protein [Anaeromyxobacter sp.]
ALGAVKVGASASQRLTVSNVGELPLLLSSISATGDFTQAGSCGASVAPGASCEPTVTFAPARGGNRTGELRIVHDADGSPTVIALSGVGQDFSITAYPSSLSAPAGSVIQMSALVGFEGGWSDPVSVACSGMPSPGRCILAPTTIVPGGNGLVAVELHTAGVTLASAAEQGGPLPLAGLLVLPGAGLWTAGRRARRRRLALLAAVVAAATIAGCGGGGGPTDTARPASVAPGTYTITIRATSAGVEKTATVSLRVTAPYP